MVDDDRERPLRSWREREAADEPRGVALDPTRDPVPGVQAFSTVYAPGHLIITGAADAAISDLTEAGAELGWGVEPEPVSARRGAELTRARIYPAPKPDRDDEPVPPVDAWRLLQHARARAVRDGNRTEQSRQAARAATRGITRAADRRRFELPPDHPLRQVGLDHVLSIDPIGINPHTKTNPHGKTNPHTKTNPHGKTNPSGTDGYADPGTGGLQMVSYIGPLPDRGPDPADGRRPVVAIVDTGCGTHEWLPAEPGEGVQPAARPIVRRRVPTVVGTTILGVENPATDPEVDGDQAGALDGFLDGGAGHGTFVAGIVRQVAPEADLISIRVADSNGTVLESELIEAIEELADWVEDDGEGGERHVDVLNLSLGYYHETPEDGLYSTRLYAALRRLRDQGCVVVCSAGNDATDRPVFPAALWAWGGAGDNDLHIEETAGKQAQHLAIGALNPNLRSVALYSNIGPWVTAYAPGTSVLSTVPPLNGGVQAGSRDDLYGRVRETIDPDDMRGGFAIWSGTSFAAPYVAGLIAAELTPGLRAGGPGGVAVVDEATDKALAHVTKKDLSRKDSSSA